MSSTGRTSSRVPFGCSLCLCGSAFQRRRVLTLSWRRMSPYILCVYMYVHTHTNIYIYIYIYVYRYVTVYTCNYMLVHVKCNYTIATPCQAYRGAEG